MISDTERREVARRLREPFDVIGQGRYVALNGTLFGMQLLAGDEDTLRAGIARLADLIEQGEPEVKYVAEVKVDGWRIEELAHGAAVELTGIDRDALLELADELQFAQPMGRTDYETVGNLIDAMDDAACRIREALGAES